jgi:dienelactone hydrolase
MPSPPATMPSALRAAARWERLGADRIPAMIVPPQGTDAHPVPAVLWMHGRTVSKELDPGRYLRWMRAGIGTCAVDLPGHGERYDAALQGPDRTLDVIRQMLEEVDGIVDALTELEEFDMARLAIGGMSAGGMVTLARLCARHPFRCASVEATSGSWASQSRRPMFQQRPDEEVAAIDPIRRLDNWREIPVQAIHSRFDEWMAYDGQAAFINALRDRYSNPGLLELIVYERTGAPHEHAGFGRMASDAKDRQRDFLRARLIQSD